jgi:hypothetical protein
VAGKDSARESPWATLLPELANHSCRLYVLRRAFVVFPKPVLPGANGHMVQPSPGRFPPFTVVALNDSGRWQPDRRKRYRRGAIFSAASLEVTTACTSKLTRSLQFAIHSSSSLRSWVSIS